MEHNIKELADFLKESVNTLITSKYTCCEYKLDNDLSVFVGWTDGYDPDDEGYIHDKNEPTFVVAAKIASNHEYLKTDLDWLVQPYYESDGEVWDTEITLTETSNFEEDADWFLKSYENMRVALDKGELLLESKNLDRNYSWKLETSRDLNSEELSTFIEKIKRGYHYIEDNSGIVLARLVVYEDNKRTDFYIDGSYLNNIANKIEAGETEGTLADNVITESYDKIDESLDNENKMVKIMAYGKIYYEFSEEEWEDMSDDEKESIILDTSDQASEEEGFIVECDEVEIKYQDIDELEEKKLKKEDVSKSQKMIITDGKNITELDYYSLDFGFGIGDYFYNGNETGAQIGFVWNEDKHDCALVDSLFLNVYVGDEENNDISTSDVYLRNLTPNEEFKVTLSPGDYSIFLRWKKMCDVKEFTFWNDLNEGLKLKIEAKFKDKVKAIKRSLKKNDKRLSDGTAQKSAERIAGSMIKKEESGNSNNIQDLETLANDIMNFMGADMGTWFDELQDNEEEAFYDTLSILESGDEIQLQILVNNIAEADIDEETAGELGIKSSDNLVKCIKDIMMNKKEESLNDGWKPGTDLYNRQIEEIANNLGISKNEVQKEGDSIKFRYNGKVYFAEPVAMYQVNIFDDNHNQIGWSVLTDKIKEEVFTDYISNNKFIYQLVGGKYAGEYTKEELEKLDLINGNTGENLGRRDELKNQPTLKDYFGPMWNGIKGGNAVIRYETPDMYDMLSESNKLNENRTEDYWDAKELVRDGFTALLKFNFGTDKDGNNYIITKDAYDIRRFSAKSDEEAIKFYNKWKNAERNAFGDYILEEADIVDRPEDILEAEEEITEEPSEDVIEDREESKTVLDLLQDRVGQQLEVGRLNAILQSVFGMYNKTFILPTDLYNMNLDETQELTVFDDEDEYSISYDIINIDDGIIEITGVDVL